MNRLVFFILIIIYFLCISEQVTLAQSTDSEEQLAVALSQDNDFKNFYLENMRFLKLKDQDALSNLEEKSFHQQQEERVNDVKARFPQLTILSKKEAMIVRNKAFALVRSKLKTK